MARRWWWRHRSSTWNMDTCSTGRSTDALGSWWRWLPPPSSSSSWSSPYFASRARVINIKVSFDYLENYFQKKLHRKVDVDQEKKVCQILLDTCVALSLTPYPFWFFVSYCNVIIIIHSDLFPSPEEAQKTLEESLAGETEERGSLAMDLYRSRVNSACSGGAGAGAGGGGGGTLRRGGRPPPVGKSPPRPSPASVAYHSDEESLRAYDENPDDSSLTEKPSEMSSSDSQVITIKISVV